MLQLGFIRSNREKVLEGLKKKNFQDLEVIDKIIASDDLRKNLQFNTEELLAKRNAASKAIGALIAQGKKEEAEAKKAEVSAIKETIDNYALQLAEVEAQVDGMLVRLPNLPNERVPEGKSADDNTVIRQHGEIPKLHDGAVPHWDLITKYDLVDFQTGVKITGSGFALYKGKGSKLQRALIQYFLDHNIAAGYTEYMPPYVVNTASAYGTGQLPDKEGQMYHMAIDDLYLIPTAEVPVTNIYRDEIIPSASLPVKMTAYTPCFRREAGSFGKDVRGLNRVHQFDKVELFRYVRPEDSESALAEMTQDACNILDDLEIPWRLLGLAAGDIAFAAAKTIDIEAWSPGVGKWLEVSSASCCTDFQSRRAKIRFRPEPGAKPEFVHLLNASGLALPRVVAALLETHQQEDGSIRVPAALQPYLGGMTVLEPGQTRWPA